ncbi:MAG: hypothetical protein ACRYG4_07760 [Janthinobacterium lividum]
MSIMLPIDRRKQAPATAPRVHPSWAQLSANAIPAAVPAKLDAARLSRLWDAVDGD